MSDEPVGDAQVESWMQRYFAAWRSNDRDEVADLFTPGAEYAVSPFAPPWIGRDEIARRWTTGEGTLVSSRSELLATRDATAVVHWNVVIGLSGGEMEEDGILLLVFDPDGRCSSHHEWFADRVLDS